MRHDGEWISKHTIVDLARAHGGYTGDQTSVRLRELERSNQIEGRKDDHGYQEYRYTGDAEAKRLKAIEYFDNL